MFQGALPLRVIELQYNLCGYVMKSTAVLVLSAFYLLSCAGASASQIRLAESTHYRYIFEVQTGEIQINPVEYFYEDVSWIRYRADETVSSGTYLPYLSISFWHHGNIVMDLEGKSLDLVTVFSMPPDLFAGAAYDNFARWDYSAPSGHITFGADNVIVDWEFGAYLPVSFESEQHRSTVVYLSSLLSLGYDIVNEEEFRGRAAYGIGFYNQYGARVWTDPGRWTSSVERVCWIEDENGGAAAPTSCPDAISPVPLPPSLALLASGLLGTVLLGRRSRQVARS